MLTCRGAAERLSRALDAPLPAGERVGLGFHLLYCGHCRRYRRQLRILDAACRAAADGALPPDDVRLSEPAREQIAAALDRQANGGGR